MSRSWPGNWPIAGPSWKACVAPMWLPHVTSLSMCCPSWGSQVSAPRSPPAARPPWLCAALQRRTCLGCSVSQELADN